MFLKKPPFKLPPLPGSDLRDIEKAFARVFATDDGKKVLAHLSAVTFARAAGMDAPDNALRYMEGQRALLASVLRMIDRGRAA